MCAARLEIVEFEAEPGEVELDVLGERAVSQGEDEAVASGPRRIGRIEGERVMVEVVGDGSEAHRGAGVTAAGLLHGVGGEEAGGVDCAGVEVCPGQGCHVVE